MNSNFLMGLKSISCLLGKCVCLFQRTKFLHYTWKTITTVLLLNNNSYQAIYFHLRFIAGSGLERDSPLNCLYVSCPQHCNTDSQAVKNMIPTSFKRI